MKLMDILIDELNKNEQDEKWERMHSEQYEIVDTENGRFRIRKDSKKETP